MTDFLTQPWVESEAENTLWATSSTSPSTWDSWDHFGGMEGTSKWNDAAFSNEDSLMDDFFTISREHYNSIVME